jgi:type I restriction enzyme M protein
MLDSGIEVEVVNNNLFDLKVFDLCTENNPVKYIFSFRVGDEVITFGVMQRTEVVEKIVDREDLEEDKYFSKLVKYTEVKENNYNLSVSTYVEKEDTREVVDIKVLNDEIKRIVARENELRLSIDEIIKDIEGDLNE